jgi:DNA-binding transcriptional LysR family regulator
MRDFCLGVTGSLRVRANTAAITEHLPAAIGAFLAAQPAIDLDLEERSSERVVADVASGAADIGIASDAVETAAVATRTFRSDRLVLIVPQGHRLARARQVAFQQLADEHFVGLTQDRALQQLLDSKFAALGRPSRVRVRLASFEGVAQMVGAGAGIAVLPERTAQRLSRRARVRCVGLNDDWTRRRLLVCTPGRTPMSKAASAFLALLGCDPDPPRAERPAPRFSGRPLA